MEKESVLTLETIPVDVIITVFHYLDEKSLCRISQVCRQFNQLASSNSLWSKWKGNCIIVSYLPWLKLHGDMNELYLAVGDAITKYKRKCWMNGYAHKAFQNLGPSSASNTVVHRGLDVVRFDVNECYIVSGGWHGVLSIASTKDLTFFIHENAHASDICDVAIFENVIVSGSRDQSFKIWKINEENLQDLELRNSEIVHDTVLSISINRTKRLLAVGTGGVGGVHPLQIKDLESGRHVVSLGESFRNGAGVLDSHFQTPDLLMTTGYDTYVRLWDMRVNHRNCVRSWEEPHDNTVYSVASDNRYGFVSGSCRHGVTRVWDTRMKNCIQTFYLGGTVSSPVNTLGFTHSHLFAGLARGLFVLDFR